MLVRPCRACHFVYSVIVFFGNDFLELITCIPVFLVFYWLFGSIPVFASQLRIFKLCVFLLGR